MKKIITPILLSFLCLASFSIPLQAMKRKNESGDTNPRPPKKRDIGEDKASASLIPALVNNNQYVFDQRNVESIKALLDFQSRRYVEHLLIYLQPQMTPEIMASFDEFIKQPAALGIGFLKEKLATNKLAYFIALQFYQCVMVTEKQFSAGDASTALMNFLEFRNIQLTITGLMTLSSPLSEPVILSENEIMNLIDIFEKDISDYTELQSKFKAAYPILYPFTAGIEEIQESHIDEIIEIITNNNDEEKLEVALCLFGNITRAPEAFKAKLDVDVALFSALLSKYIKFPIIMENISFCLRNQALFCDKNKLDEYGSLLSKLFSYPSEKVVQWASRGFGTKLERELEFNAPVGVEEIYPVLNSEYESVVTWALSFCGKFLSNGKIRPLHAIDGAEIYSNVLSVLRSQDERKIKSGKIIESALWTLGEIVLRQEIEDEGLDQANKALFFSALRPANNIIKRKVIPKEVIKYIDFENLKIFPENGEKIILFACRCLSHLTAASGVNRIPVSPELLQKVVSLFDSNNEKIVVWSLCYLGTLSTNTATYNAEIRAYVGSKDIIQRLLKCFGQYSENGKILEAALWSIHKIAWCEQHKNSLRELGCTAPMLTKFLSHSSDKVREGACLCFGVLASSKDNLKEYINQITPHLENELRNQNSQLRLIAVRSLNTLATSATKGCENNRIAIGKRKDVIKLLADLLSTNEPLLLESVCWCLGNLSVDENNSAYIAPLVLDQMILLINKNNPIYSNMNPGDIAKVFEGACYCLCNVLVESSINHEMMQDYGNVALFFINLLDKDPTGEYKNCPKVIEMSLWALHKLICGKDASSVSVYKSIIQSNKAFEKVVSLLEYPDEKIVAGACWCFGKMAPWSEEQSNKLESGRLLLDLLERYSNLANEKLVILALRCIGTNCVNECSEAQKRYIGAVGMPTLLKILQKRSDNLALIETCSWAIASLLLFKENIQHFIKQNGLSIFRDLLERKCNDKTKDAILFMYSKILEDNNVLTQIAQYDVNFIVKMKDDAVAKMLEISTKKDFALAKEDKIQSNVQTTTRITSITTTTTTTTSMHPTQTGSNAPPEDEVAKLAEIVARAEQCLKILFDAGIYRGDVK